MIIFSPKSSCVVVIRSQFLENEIAFRKFLENNERYSRYLFHVPFDSKPSIWVLNMNFKHFFRKKCNSSRLIFLFAKSVDNSNQNRRMKNKISSSYWNETEFVSLITIFKILFEIDSFLSLKSIFHCHTRVLSIFNTR